MSDQQVIRITNYGECVDNINLTHALHAVGVSTANASKGDIVYVVLERDGRVLCDARGVLQEQLPEDAFKWPDGNDFKSTWQIDGELQFCDPFDMSALKSSRDASQYLWYIQTAEVVENPRIVSLLHQLFEANAISDGSLVLHENLRKHAEASLPAQSFEKPLSTNPIQRQFQIFWRKFKAWIMDDADANFAVAPAEVPSLHSQPLENIEEDDETAQDPALKAAAEDEKVFDTGFGLMSSIPEAPEETDRFDLQSFAQELDDELAPTVQSAETPSSSALLESASLESVDLESLSLDLPGGTPAESASSIPEEFFSDPLPEPEKDDDLSLFADTPDEQSLLTGGLPEIDELESFESSISEPLLATSTSDALLASASDDQLFDDSIFEAEPLAALSPPENASDSSEAILDDLNSVFEDDLSESPALEPMTNLEPLPSSSPKTASVEDFLKSSEESEKEESKILSADEFLNNF